MLAETTLFNLSVDAWSATGIWVTIAVYIALAIFAWRQISEARTLRRETTRPYMVAELKAKSILISIVFKNIGKTEARDVQIRLDRRFESTTKSEAAWQDSRALKGAIPSFPPGHSIEFFIDSFPRRREAGLPMEIAGTFSYEDSTGRPIIGETFHINLDVYGDASVPDKDISDVAEELKQIRQVMAGWVNQGLHVKASDKDRRGMRHLRARRVVRTYRQQGIGPAFLRWWQNTAAARSWRRWTS